MVMDGKKNIEQLKQILLPIYPNETFYFEELLLALDKEFLIENTLQNVPHDLTDYDITRWAHK